MTAIHTLLGRADWAAARDEGRPYVVYKSAASLDGRIAQLHERGVSALLLDGGPTLAGSFIAARLIDRVIAYLAPALLGAGKAALNDAGIATIADAARLTVHDISPQRPRRADRRHNHRGGDVTAHSFTSHQQVGAMPGWRLSSQRRGELS